MGSRHFESPPRIFFEEDMKAFDVDVRNAKLPNGKTISEDFWSRVAGGFTVVVEEYVAKG